MERNRNACGSETTGTLRGFPLAAPIFLLLLLGLIAFSRASELRAIQRGTATIVTSTGRVYVTLGTVLRDTTKAFLVFSETETGSTLPSKHNVAGRILGDDSLVFVRQDVGTSNLNTISWEVYEFTSGVSVQRGAVNPTTTSTNITLATPVDLSKSFAIATHFRGGTVFGGDDAFTATLSTTTNLKLDFGATPGDSTYWQVIQYEDCLVQQVATSLAAATASTTSTIPVSVNTAKTMVISNFRTASDFTSAGDLPRTELTNGTTLTFTRGGGTSGALSLVSYVIQFTDSTTVTRATTNFTAGTGTVNVTLSPAIDTGRTGVIAPGHMNRGGSTAYTTGNSMGYAYFSLALTSTTNLAITRGDNAGSTSDMPYQLVTFSKNEYEARNYNTTINFNTTSTGANVSTDQTNFPVLVRLDANNFLFTQADQAGADIRFADPDGQALKYQIERWDYANKLAEIWVLVPQVDGNSTSDFIRMYWGNNNAMSASSGSAVFPTGNSWSGVWHLGEDGNTTANGYLDASSNGYHAQGTLTTSASDVSGAIGLGQNLDGSTQYISMTGTYPAVATARTMSLWTRMTTVGGSNMVIAAYGTYPGTGSQVFGLANWSGNRWGAWTDGTGNTNTGATADQGWHHLSASYDGTTVRMYLDGAQIATATSALNTTSGSMTLGARMSDKTLKWPAIVDELRISSVQRSADWIKLEYQNQKTGSKFLSMPNTALSTWTYSTKVYVNTSPAGANITTTQTNYPLLVRLTNANFNFAQALSTGADLR
ncbi:MAG: hypothetical protein JWP91_3557, partial [Fibrobacteres bacterium]|nr:hypothetical protein [Fibrobacterota bacterium]